MVFASKCCILESRRFDWRKLGEKKHRTSNAKSLRNALGPLLQNNSTRGSAGTATWYIKGLASRCRARAGRDRFLKRANEKPSRRRKTAGGRRTAAARSTDRRRLVACDRRKRVFSRARSRPENRVRAPGKSRTPRQLSARAAARPYVRPV